MADSSSTQHFVKKEFLKESSSNEKDVKNEVLKESDCDQKDVEKKSVKETGPEEQKDKKKPEKRKKKGENETRVPKKPLVKRFKMIEERKQRFNKVQPIIESIDNAIKAFDSPEIPKTKVKVEDMLLTFEPIKEAIEKSIEAGKEKATDEDMIVAAKMVEKANSEMLTVSKVVTRFASVKAFRFRLSETVKDIAVELRKLLHLVRRHVPSQPYDAAYDVAINLAKSNLEKSMKSLFGIIENIQTGGSRSNAIVKVDQHHDSLNSPFNLNESVGSPDNSAASPEASSPLALSVHDEDIAESSQEFIPFVDYPPSPVPSQVVEDEEASFTLEYAPSPDSTLSDPVVSFDSEPKSSPLDSPKISYFENTAVIPLSPVAQTFPIVEPSQGRQTSSNVCVEISKSGSCNDIESFISDVSPGEIDFSISCNSMDLPLHTSEPLCVTSPNVKDPNQELEQKSDFEQQIEFSSGDRSFEKIEKSFESAVKAESPSSLEDGEIEDSIDYPSGPPTPRVAEPYPGIYGNRGNDTIDYTDETSNIIAQFSPLGDANLSMEEENVPSSSNSESNNEIDSKSKAPNPTSTAAIDKCSNKVPIPRDSLSAEAWELECILKINASMEDVTSNLPTLPSVIEPFAPIITNVVSMAHETNSAPSPSFGDVFIGTEKEEVPVSNLKMEVMAETVLIQPSVTTTPPSADVDDTRAASNSSPESAYFSASVEDPRESRCSNFSNPSPVQGEEVYVSFVSSPNHFWIQRKSCEEPIAQLEETLKSIDAEPAVNQFVIGDLYGVKHPEYYKWYRARLDQNDGEKHQVMFVDYGDTHLVPSTSLRQLSVLNRYVPPFAVGCTFRSYVQVGELEQEKVLAFTDCTDGIVCHAVFGEKVGDLQIVESLYAGDINVFKLLFGDREVENVVEIQGIPRQYIPWKLTPIHVSK